MLVNAVNLFSTASSTGPGGSDGGRRPAQARRSPEQGLLPEQGLDLTDGLHVVLVADRVEARLAGTGQAGIPVVEDTVSSGRTLRRAECQRLLLGSD